jgi:hypothetical protein
MRGQGLTSLPRACYAVLMDKPIERDWTAIEEDFRAGALSIATICKFHGVARDKLMSHARKNGWVRSVSYDVYQEVQERLVFGENEPGSDAVTKTAALQVEALLGHRRDIAKLRSLVLKSSESIERILDGNSSEADAATLGRTGVVGALDTLGSVMQRLIPMERAALGIGAPPEVASSPSAAAATGGGDGQPQALVQFYLPSNHREPRDD